VHLEPVLLKAALTAVLYLLALTLGAAVERDELLLKVVVALVLSHFENLLERAHGVLALTHVYYFIIRWIWNSLCRADLTRGLRLRVKTTVHVIFREHRRLPTVALPLVEAISVVFTSHIFIFVFLFH
jgi:hypothetical protein